MSDEAHKSSDAHTIMTVREVAEYLRLSEAKVYRLANEGLIPVARLGKSWRFRKDLLDAWLVEQSRQESHATGSLKRETQAASDLQEPEVEEQEASDAME
jgi:excisionase family DNA binding protein